MSAALRKDHAVLAGLLVVQLVLAAVTWNASGRSAPEDVGKQAVFAATADDVTSVEIEATSPRPELDGSRIELVRDGDEWKLASAGGYPAKAEKADELIEQLLGLRVGDVIASNRASHESLRVGERQFDRRVTIATDDGTETVILGNGPRSSLHVRREGEDEVRVARGTAVHAIRADDRNYVDVEYVAVEKDDLTRIEITNEHGALLLTKNEDGWAVADLPAGASLDEGAVVGFINNIARMTLQKPIGNEVDPSYGLDNGARVVMSGDGDEQSVYADYTVGAAADERSYYAKAADSEFVVTIPKWGAEQIRDKKIDDFVSKPPAPAESN